MTRLFDDPARFTEDALAGFLDVNKSIVVGVPGGVVRAEATRPGKVAVVVGGGSGHYPAFCGLVGLGFADGAVVGNVFTSPSTDEAVSVARAADGGGGVLFSYGNYAGDVMNFGLAEQKLREAGIDPRTVIVTDDIASAPRGEEGKRRGIAGNFVVFKIAGAAAEAGYDLDGVERIARVANDRTRTLGIAFDGCTLPGQGEPLFTVPAGHMAVGLGIHGEPGISDNPMPTASALAEILVNGVLAETPADQSGRITALLNGLGSTKYEELFIVWRTVAARLAEAGFTVVEPEVGELVTSLDMAGCSLTIVFLNEELEELWSAATHTPAYRKGATLAAASTSRRRTAEVRRNGGEIAKSGSAESQRYSAIALLCLERLTQAIADNESELGNLDAIAGDGDHGRGMVRGSSAALDAARTTAAEGLGVGSVLGAAGDAWAARAGGTSGVLWGAMVRAFGCVLGDENAVTPDLVSTALCTASRAMQDLGKAELGDKTMLDALEPFTREFANAVLRGSGVGVAWTAAASKAETAANSSADLTPKRGRARPLAERSIGHRDPGAVSLAMIMRVIADTLESTKRK
jgi:dihydroxyacetone kinase